MKNPFRRRWLREPPSATFGPALVDTMRDPLKNAKPAEVLLAEMAQRAINPPAPMVKSRPALDPDVQAAISAALEKHPAPVAAGGRFFGVPLSYFNRDELMQIISWVADNARDHRRDL